MDKSLGSEGGLNNGEQIPVYCEFVIRRNGDGYDVRHWGDVTFTLYPDQSFFIRCVPPGGAPFESLEFRGVELTSYTTYPISEEGHKGSIKAHFELPEFVGGGYTDPFGTFKVGLINGEGLGSWFIGEFEFSLKLFAVGGEEVDYSIKSLVFQVQANHAG